MEVRRNRLLGRYVTMAVLMALAGLLGYRFSERTGMARLQVEASYRLDLFAMTIESIVNRYAHVPTTIELREDVIAALRTPGDSALVDRTNRYLAQLSARIGSIGIFLLGTDGVTLASSNWSRPDNLIGEDLSFRPYFRTAIAGGALRYYAIGNTEGAPGYFVSYSVRDGAEIVGVAVVKIGLSAVERSWLPLGAPRPDCRRQRRCCPIFRRGMAFRLAGLARQWAGGWRRYAATQPSAGWQFANCR